MLQFIDPTFRHSCLVPSLGVMKALEFYDSIPCNNCDNEYIGQTKRQFGTRLIEHQKAVFFWKKENSALPEHIYLINHTIGRDNSKIITTNRRYHQCLCLEAWHMKN